MLLRVRRARLEKGMTLAQVSKKIGIAAQALSRVENGRAQPWPALRERLSTLYNVPDEVLFWDIDAAYEHLKKVAGKSISEIVKLEGGDEG